MAAAAPEPGGSALKAAADAWVYALGPGRYYDPVYRRVAGSLDLQAGTLLDLGCGPGWVSIHAAAGHPELDCVGVDLNPTMVRIAQHNARGRLNCTFRVMDAAQIVYPDHTFDRVVALGTMHHWTRPEAVLAEVFRVLKPGGWACLLDADASAPIPPDWMPGRPLAGLGGLRLGRWPPEAWLRRNWRRYALGEAGLERLREQLGRLPWASVREDTLGFYRRLVATR